MDNYQIIQKINEIVNPFWMFEMDDFYGDKGGIPYPKIEELKNIMFKLNGKNRKLMLTVQEEKEMIQKIKNLDIGTVEILKINSLGKYICITPK